MTEKSASVLWDGAGKEGLGKISTESGALMDYPYGFASRFGEDRRGTNPEEILAAAHAACFTMAFSFACKKAGFETRTLDTRAKVRLSAQGEGFVIDRITLHLRAVVPGLDEARSRRSPVRPSVIARCPRRWSALRRSAWRPCWTRRRRRDGKFD